MKKALFVVAFLLVCSQAFAAFSLVESDNKFKRTAYLYSDSIINEGAKEFNALKIEFIMISDNATITIKGFAGELSGNIYQVTQTNSFTGEQYTQNMISGEVFTENKNIPQIVRQIKNTPAYNKNALRVGSEPEIVEESLDYDAYMTLIDKETVYGALASVLQS